MAGMRTLNTKQMATLTLTNGSTLFASLTNLARGRYKLDARCKRDEIALVDGKPINANLLDMTRSHFEL